jgi:hypothetical protein
MGILFWHQSHKVGCILHAKKPTVDDLAPPTRTASRTCGVIACAASAACTGFRSSCVRGMLAKVPGGSKLSHVLNTCGRSPDSSFCRLWWLVAPRLTERDPADSPLCCSWLQNCPCCAPDCMPAGVLTADMMRSSHPGSAGLWPPLPLDVLGLSDTAVATGTLAAAGALAVTSSCSNCEHKDDPSTNAFQETRLRTAESQNCT